MQGRTLIHRKMRDREWYTDIPTKTLFLHLILSVNHKPKRWRWILVKRGQTITSRWHLAKETWLSEQQVRTALQKLKTTNEVTSKTTSKYTVITLLNYSKYQDWNSDSNQHSNQQITNKQPTNNQQITTNNNDNNVNNDNNENKKERGRKFKKPTLEELEAYRRENKLYYVDTEVFFNHYETNWRKVGKNKMKNWKSALSWWNAREKKKQ